MQAVELNGSGLVFFSTIELPEPLRREITEGGGRIRDGVDLLDPRPSGNPGGSDHVLCVSRADPAHFEFIDRRQVDLARLRVVDNALRVLGTVEDWRKFLDLKEELRAMAAAVTGVEASGSLEVPA